jgi:5-methylcytosine-specific restriction endonuclease McrA
MSQHPVVISTNPDGSRKVLIKPSSPGGLGPLKRENQNLFLKSARNAQRRLRKKLKKQSVPPNNAKKVKVWKKDQVQKLNTFNAFYSSEAWLRLRYRALTEYGRICMCCRKATGQMHVDHIKPRSKHPELQLRFDNLQVLCRDCNLGKSNLDQTDFRTTS